MIQYLEVDRKKVRISRSGPAKAHSLVFLHGYPENLRLWDRTAERLSRRYDCIALDWPGMGESEDWTGGAAPKHMAARLQRILQTLAIQRPTLVATDMGVQAALEFAAGFPENVATVVAMNALIADDESTSWEIDLLRRYGFNRWALRTMPRIIFRRARHTFLNRGETIGVEALHDFWNSFRKPAVRKFISKMCAGYQGTLPSLPDRYRQIQAPVLILWAEKDAHFPPSHGRRLAELISDSRLEVLASAGHWMAWTRADEVAERIERFLRDYG
jgi:pimeloyl-ACP methyl ester carboxylesterase